MSNKQKAKLMPAKKVHEMASELTRVHSSASTNEEWEKFTQNLNGQLCATLTFLEGSKSERWRIGKWVRQWDGDKPFPNEGREFNEGAMIAFCAIYCVPVPKSNRSLTLEQHKQLLLRRRESEGQEYQ